MRKWIVTFFGSGLSPVAPGTAGSLLTAVFLLFAYRLAGSPIYWAWQVMLATGLLMACGLSVGLGTWAVAYFGREDPQPFVLDEVAGILLTNLFLPTYAGWNQAWVIATAFAAFRVFDILKPPPARQLENLPAGWGILCDDLAAAVYANIICQLIVRLALVKLIGSPP